MKIKWKRRRGAAEPSQGPYTEPYTAGPETYTEGYTAAPKSRTERIRQAIRHRLETIRAVYGYRYTDAETVRSWLESFPEIKRFERYRPIKRGVMAVCTATAFVSFYTKQPPRVTAVLFFLALASLLWFDCGRLWSRILADHARALLAAACLAWAVALRFPTFENLATAVGAFGVAALSIRLFNIRWLSDQVYQRAETVKTALQDTPPKEIDDLWRGTAAAQVRALFYELGLPLKNPHYESGLRGVYTLGFAQACTIKAGTIDRAKETFAENKRLKEELERRDAELDSIVEFAKDYERHAEVLSDLNAKLAKAEADAQAGQVARDEAERLLHENCRLEQQFNDLTIDYQILQRDYEKLQASAEPAQEVTTASEVIPIEAIDTPEERREIKLAEAAAMGYGVTRAQKYANCSHWQAQQWYSRHPEEVAVGKARATTQAEAEEA